MFNQVEYQENHSEKRQQVFWSVYLSIYIYLSIYLSRMTKRDPFTTQNLFSTLLQFNVQPLLSFFQWQILPSIYLSLYQSINDLTISMVGDKPIILGDLMNQLMDGWMVWLMARDGTFLWERMDGFLTEPHTHHSTSSIKFSVYRWIFQQFHISQYIYISMNLYSLSIYQSPNVFF